MTIVYESLGQTVSALVAMNLPILFCDTCAFLDIIRFASRQSDPRRAATLVEAAQNVLDASKRNDVVVLMHSVVATEWLDHAEKEHKAAGGHLEAIAKQHEVVSHIAKQYGSSFAPLDPSFFSVADRSFTLASDLVAAALQLPRDDGCSLRATERAAKYDPPATHGEIKDCLIYEHGLQVMRDLRMQGFGARIAFLTSNTKDYCLSRSVPKPNIEAELKAVSCKLVTTWDWAQHEVL